jgi:DNA primase
VSTPIAWSELSKDVRFACFNVQNVPKRLAKKTHADPWKQIADKAVALDKTVMGKVGFSPD